MINKRWILIAVAMLALPAVACSFSVGLGEETPGPATSVATELPTQTPQAAPSPTRPVGPYLDDLVFAAGVTDDGQPIDVVTEFPQGMTTVYAFASYEGMSDGAQSVSIWYLDGEEATRNDFDWNLGESGATWIANLENEDGLQPGRYGWELYVEGELATSGSFAVGAVAALLFEDDFSDPGSGWEVGDYDGGSVGYKDGIYFAISKGDGNNMWGVANRSFSDLVVEVDATQVSAPASNDNAYGIGCRIQPNGDGYYLVISGDGFASIVKAVGDDFELLVDWAASDVIVQGNASNRLRADCDGPDFALFANGELLVEASDSAFSEGDIALAGTSFGAEPTEIHFDKLVVREP